MNKLSIARAFGVDGGNEETQTAYKCYLVSVRKNIFRNILVTRSKPTWQSIADTTSLNILAIDNILNFLLSSLKIQKEYSNIKTVDRNMELNKKLI